MFIIEGSDCVGKTTVAEQVVKLTNIGGDFPAYYQHMTRPPEHFDFRFHYLDLMSKYAVMDRFHLGALAYHPEGTLPSYIKRWVEAHLYLRGSIIVIMYCSNDLAYRKKLERHAKERKEMFNFDFLANANKIYTELALSGSYDFTWDICQTGVRSIQPDDIDRDYYRHGGPCVEKVPGFCYPNVGDISKWIMKWTNFVSVIDGGVS